MNILLTGATGFLGSNLLASLINANHNLSILVRQTSLFNRISQIGDRVTVIYAGSDSFHNILRLNKIEAIIHCATNYGRGETRASDILEANLIMPLQLIQAGGDCGVSCFINTDTILDKGISEYALSKSQFREWLFTFSKKMACVNVALEHFYGPYDNTTKFVSYVVQQFLDNADCIELTKGEQKRDFIYIDDVVSALLLIFGRYAKGPPGYYDFEVGSGVSISIRDFVELTKDIAGNTRTRLNFGAIPYRKNETMETIVDTTRIRTLGWTPCTSLREGLTKMISKQRETRIV